ncbi:hypothetical protein L207DRAFT_570941 [Hyaloscypha variabilis F]|uniref:CHAT domain-containing protein n=1 Tax=Hyaloscypha variabilis (strain UAMH 11265 / GT02V1 / F) TaxID=1149755 RepID=A0A2J6R747_HYAVF|nr:hypothetical protein L207DRAFT_570941 [Hyaloscypha variabilis F]
MAEASESTTYRLRIFVEPSKIASPGWEVAVFLGGACFARKIALSDPFTKTEEDECRWYLEDYLTKSPFEKGRADVVVESLESYANNLFNQLCLSRVWRRLSGPASPKHKILEIDVVENAENSTEISSSTIHRLHWEVLESPRLWKNLNIRTVVRRVIPQNGTSISPIKRVESWTRGVPAVNILLVISRKLIRQGSEEVDPGLVFHSLQTLKRDLESRGSAFCLNIEVVRPGSFKALKQHLENKARYERNGDIHIVHFDVHGRVGLRSEKGEDKATTAAFLYFQSGRGDGKLAPTRAGAVAELLRKHDIRIVVLNACESAAANKGDEANIARTLTKAGVQNVLGLAYKTLGSTCTEFMRIFYDSLIAGGKPFSIAVCDAREKLRSSPDRDARFALKRPLQDWIVPVVYASGIDLELHISRIPNKDSSIEDGELVMTPKKVYTTPPAPLVGRGFDALRFETIFLESRVIGLSGPAGVGKTAFIQDLLRCWEDTGLFEKTLYVDSSSIHTDRVHTPQAILQQLLHSSHDSSKVCLTGEEQHEHQSTIAELGDSFQVIVLDNLEASLSDMKEMDDYGRWPERTRNALMTLLRDNLDTRSGEEDLRLSFILVGRSDDDVWWDKHFSQLPAFPRYQLQGLWLPDAIEFAHIVLRENGFNRSSWRHDDEDTLSQVLNILQCNPLSIVNVLRTAVSQNFPWRKLVEKILFHQFWGIRPSQPSNESSFQSRDLIFASTSGSLPPIYADVYAALALYWHQGCSKDDLKSVAGAPYGADFTQALEFGIDRGYFAVNTEGYIDNIHPLFTLIGRSIFPSANISQSRPLDRLLESDLDSLLDAYTETFIQLFFSGMLSRNLFDLTRNTLSGMKFGEAEKVLRPAFYNVLTTLRLCSLRNHILCESYWPDFLHMYGACGTFFLSADETALMVNEYEHFFRKFISRQIIPIELQTLRIMIPIGNFLTHSHIVVSTLPTKRAREFSLLTFDLIGNLEEELLKHEYLAESISVARVLKHRLGEFSQGSNASVECEGSSKRTSESVSPKETLAGVLSDSQTWEHVAHSMPSLQQLAPHFERIFQMEGVQGQITKMQQSFSSGTPSDVIQAVRLCRQSLTKVVTGEFLNAHNSEDTKLSDLENALDVRNRVEAIRNYHDLLAQASERWDWDKMIELQNSLIEIYRTDERFAEDLKQTLEGKKMVETVYHMLQICTFTAGLGEAPQTNETFLEDVKNLRHNGDMIPIEGRELSLIQSLQETAEIMKSKQVHGNAIPRPKKHFKELLGQGLEYYQKPGGQAKALELCNKLGDLSYELEQALKSGDLETALKSGAMEKAADIADRIVEVDDPNILPCIPLQGMSIYRQLLESSRNFERVQIAINQAIKERRNDDAINTIESLLHQHAHGTSGLLDIYVQCLQDTLKKLVWWRQFDAWDVAFCAEDYTQALIEIPPLRAIETSHPFYKPHEVNYEEWHFLHDVTDFMYLHTLHHHFGESKRPHLALKTVSHLLNRYDHPETELAQLLGPELSLDRIYKWFYELEIQKAKYRQSVIERDPPSIQQHSLTLLEMLMKIPVGLGELGELRKLIPKKVLARMNFEDI